MDGSLEEHPVGGQVRGYGILFGDSRDRAEPLPTAERQTNNRGELRAALHAVRNRNCNVPTLICSDSLLLVQGTTGKAQKWRRHDLAGIKRASQPRGSVATATA